MPLKGSKSFQETNLKRYITSLTYGVTNIKKTYNEKKENPKKNKTPGKKSKRMRFKTKKNDAKME